MTNVDHENVWEIIKKLRMSFLSESTDIDCNYENTLLSDKTIQDNTNSLAAKLQLNITSTANQNVSYKILRAAGKMFTYLNYCPSIIPKQFLILANIFRAETLRNMILALTSIMKSLENAEEKKEVVGVFLNIMNTFSLKEFENI